MDNLGKCPVCGKGELVKGSNGWTCNYFKSGDDNCRFTIYFNYFGVSLTPETAKRIVERGESEVLDFVSEKTKQPFRAFLKITDGYIKPVFEKNEKEFEKLKSRCPSCGGNVLITSKAFICTNHFNDKLKCPLYIPKKIAGVEIDEDMAEVLLSGEPTEWIDGFSGTYGEFSGRMILDERFNVKIDTSICKCPICKKGNVFQGKKAFNCSNWKNENVKCDFTVWKEINGKKITPDIVEKLCFDTETDEMSGFKNQKGEPVKMKLILTDDNKVKAI